MKKVNEILAVVILSLMAVLMAAVGMRLYDTYVENREIESELRQQEEVLSRNREAHDRVQEMRREIEELSGDREKLGQFLEEIRMDYEEAVPASAMMDFGTGGMTGNREIAEEQGVSENAADAADDMLSLSENEMDVADSAAIQNGIRSVSGSGTVSDNTPWASGHAVSVSGNATSVSENMTIVPESTTTVSDDVIGVSGNRRSVSGNDTASGNGFSVSGNDMISGNDTVSGNGFSVSGNDMVSGNGFSVSGNDMVSGNGFGVSGNATVSDHAPVSGNMLDLLPNIEMVYPEITLAQRRQIRRSMEETFLANWEDQACLEERGVDFSGKKIACLGDSITAAANLEGEEGYLSYAYPSVLKELLGAEEVYNLGVGGSSIGRYWSDAFVERYTQIPEDTDIIIVMGGTNDGFCLSGKEFGTLAERKPWTFCGDLDELMRGLKENYPDADIFFATPLPNILQDYLMRERTYLLPQKNIADMILTLSAAYDFQVIDLYNSNILDSHDADIVADYMPDGVHANRAGYRILAEHIAARLVRHYEENE
ncbi:MAG: hypothetical protein K2M20_06665 [Lachnospiraceae bacterium]|nr:hypothetical protein [Lachnospiraceae bacterium]